MTYKTKEGYLVEGTPGSGESCFYIARDRKIPPSTLRNGGLAGIALGVRESAL